uniref:Uncharacterized protein n=1 Tax=Amphimedon queenslandica TaxID=400682 RepID=A0A1X7T3Y9_AMPQE
MSDSEDEEILAQPVGPLKKHYFLKIGPSFTGISNWLQRKLDANEARIVGTRTIQTGCIYPAVNREPSWSRVYDFTRRIATVVRFYVLEAGNLNSERCLGKKIKLANHPQLHRRRDENPFGMEINNDNYLVENSFEGQWLMAHIDMLLPHFHIQNQLRSQRGNRSDITAEMIVVDYQSRVVWQIISAVNITNEGQNDAGFRFISEFQVTFNRLHFENEECFRDYPYMASDSDNIDELIRGVESL